MFLAVLSGLPPDKETHPVFVQCCQQLLDEKHSGEAPLGEEHVAATLRMGPSQTGPMVSW